MPNRLQHETSPYLLQHAGNPVDWFAWGPEAFNEARRRDVPILLSVGYATCYWCHVMERESFEDRTLADRLNTSFVAIKVDREERPDVDEIFMAATQIMTGRGGWPMNCFLEPNELRPFWCGTYFPPEPRQGMPSFSQVLEAMANAWRNDRPQVVEQARRVADAVREQLAETRAPVPVADPQITRAIEHLMRLFDATHGGFGGAPKFPQPAYLSFLLAARKAVDNDESRAAVDHAIRHTLDRIAIGGMHDQVGGGFHRYSVDATWTVPHFEKMLYDNAQLTLVYAEAAVAFEDPYYRRVVRRTLDYVLREMTRSDGAEGFFSAQDAEVDHREGLNYLWTAEEFAKALGPDADWAATVYGVDLGPNFKDPHHPDEPARSVLRLKDRPDRLAEVEGTSTDAFLRRLDGVNAALLAVRDARKQPLTDDKILASWNGLMIQALVAGGRLLGDDRALAAAAASARFIVEAMRDADGELLRASRLGQAHTPAFLEDYAAMIRALCALHRAAPRAGGFDARAAATDLARRARNAFSDGTGRYHDTRADPPDLFVRPRSSYDGAMPSGVSMMLHALLDLHELEPDADHDAHAAALLESLSADIARSPVAAVHSTEALLRVITSPSDALRGRIDRAAAATSSPQARTPVQVFVDVEALTVTPDTPGVVTVRLVIADGYHIIAARPGQGGGDLIPLRVGLTAGAGVAVYADYPPGEPYGDNIRVHTGAVEFTVVVEHAPGVGARPGEPSLGVTFQACTDTECLAPATIPLRVDIHIENET